MIKSPISIISACLLLTSNTHAQNKPIACQTIASAGLNWQNGEWKVTKFFDKKFILVMGGENLTNESVAKVLDTNSVSVDCKSGVIDQIYCTDTLGGYLIFHPKTMKGGLSKIFGAMDFDIKNRDSVLVRSFSCERF